MIEKIVCVCRVLPRLANKKEKSQLNEPNEKRPLFNLYNEGSGDVSSSRDRTTTRCCYQRLVYIYIPCAHTHIRTRTLAAAAAAATRKVY